MQKFAVLVLLCCLFAFSYAENENEKGFEETSLTGQKCSNSSDCMGDNVSCDGGRCRCDYLFTPIRNSGTKEVFCINRCEQNFDCVNRFDQHTWCTPDKHCKCHGGFDVKENKCFTPQTGLGQRCDNSTECGEGAGCDGIKGICECRVGYAKLNEHSCAPVPCQTDMQCGYMTNHSTCFATDNSMMARSCICNGRYIDYETYCVSRGADIGKQCEPDARHNPSGCGKEAACVKDQCICKFGYIPVKGDTIDCHLFECDHSQQCRNHLMYNSVCDLWEGRCVCEEGFYLDERLQECVKENSFLEELLGKIFGKDKKLPKN